MPDISILVPTFNRGLLLAQTLESIARLLRPADPVEVIVVDNGSTDGTAETCRDVAQRFPKVNWRCLYEPMPGLLSARHRAAKEARGEILAYLDDDVLLAPTWLDALKDAFSNPDIALAGGPSRPHYLVSPPEWLDAFWAESENGRHCYVISLIDGGAEIKPADPLTILGLNFAVRKRVFEDCGGFHPDIVPKALQRYQGDGETGLSLKIKKKGLACLYHPAMALQHVIPASRLTPASIEARGFFQGVCNSFTKIREQGRPDEDVRGFAALLREWKRQLHQLLRPGSVEPVRKLYDRALVAGYVYHQREARTDPRLMEWILKTDFMDYALPDDWRAHMGQYTN